jgi:TPR repeat protein
MRALFMKALLLAEKGNAEAQYNLGVMYAKGEGVPQDYAGAVKWYRLAAEQGYAEAQYNLGVMYGQGRGVPKDQILSFMWTILAASRGLDDARESWDQLAREMTPAQIAEAQRLAREWNPTK